MTYRTILFAAALATLPVTAALAADAQPQRHIVSTYHAVPGHQAELMRWLAQQDQAAAAAGVAPAQLYVHTDGASWDYMVVQPVTTDEQDAKIDAELKKLGAPSGAAAGLEFRKHIQSHEDTFVMGPMTAADYLKQTGN